MINSSAISMLDIQLIYIIYGPLFSTPRNVFQPNKNNSNWDIHLQLTILKQKTLPDIAKDLIKDGYEVTSMTGSHFYLAFIDIYISFCFCSTNGSCLLVKSQNNLTFLKLICSYVHNKVNILNFFIDKLSSSIEERIHHVNTFSFLYFFFKRKKSYLLSLVSVSTLNI